MQRLAVDKEIVFLTLNPSPLTRWLDLKTTFADQEVELTGGGKLRPHCLANTLSDLEAAMLGASKPVSGADAIGMSSN